MYSIMRIYNSQGTHSGQNVKSTVSKSNDGNVKRSFRRRRVQECDDDLCGNLVCCKKMHKVAVRLLGLCWLIQGSMCSHITHDYDDYDDDHYYYDNGGDDHND